MAEVDLDDGFDSFLSWPWGWIPMGSGTGGWVNPRTVVRLPRITTWFLSVHE